VPANLSSVVRHDWHRDRADHAVSRHGVRVAAGIVAFPHPAIEETGDLVVLLEAALRRGKAQAEERIGVAE